MDYFMGFPTTMGGYNSIRVVMYMVTKSTYFIPIWKRYTMKKLVECYISQIVQQYEV